VLPPDGGGGEDKAPRLPDRPCACADTVPKKGRPRRGERRPKRDADVCTVCGGTSVLPWHPRTIALWADWWSSPMAAEWVKAEVHELVLGAELHDRYFWKPDLETLKEIRLWLPLYGLTPMSRRQLNWKVSKPADKPDTPHGPSPRSADDPRKVLRMPTKASA
jgi:hypothetical protein